MRSLAYAKDSGNKGDLLLVWSGKGENSAPSNPKGLWV